MNNNTEEKTRTLLQNKSLHLYITQLAEALADAGLDMRKIIKVEITPTPENVKETMIRPVMTALYPDIKSTTELSTKQIQKLYDVMNRMTGESFGLNVEWPSKETLANESREVGED